MKVNDVLRKGEVAFRVLAMKDDICFCINCNTNFMPVWMPMSTLDEYTPDTAPMSDTNLTAKQKQVAHERYTMIAPMLAFLTDDKERNRLMNRVAAEQDISKQTLRRYICRSTAGHLRAKTGLPGPKGKSSAGNTRSHSSGQKSNISLR